jgi:hypothetical protein
VTDYLAGLVARGLGRAPGPALEPRFAPEIVSVSQQPAAPAPVEPAPSAVGEVVEEHVAARAPRSAPVEPFHADLRPVGEARPDPPRVEAARGRRPRAADPAPLREAAPKAETAAAQPVVAPRAPAAVSPSRAVPEPAAAHARRPERQQIVDFGAAPASPPPPADEKPLARPLVELLPREPAERPAIPAAPAPAARHVEVRIGRVEVRAPRAPEPSQPVEQAPVLRETPADPFVGLAVARRYVDRAWR